MSGLCRKKNVTSIFWIPNFTMVHCRGVWKADSMKMFVRPLRLMFYITQERIRKIIARKWKMLDSGTDCWWSTLYNLWCDNSNMHIIHQYINKKSTLLQKIINKHLLYCYFSQHLITSCIHTSIYYIIRHSEYIE